MSKLRISFMKLGPENSREKSGDVLRGNKDSDKPLRSKDFQGYETDMAE